MIILEKEEACAGAQDKASSCISASCRAKGDIEQPKMSFLSTINAADDKGQNLISVAEIFYNAKI